MRKEFLCIRLLRFLSNCFICIFGLITIHFIISVFNLQLPSRLLYTNYLPVPIELVEERGYLLNSSKCRIPNLPVWNEDMLPFKKNIVIKECSKPVPALTYVDKNFVRLNHEAIHKMGWNNDNKTVFRCCYRTIKRVEQLKSSYDHSADNHRRISRKCYVIKDKVIPISGFIKVTCMAFGEKVYYNYHMVAVENEGGIREKSKAWRDCRHNRNCTAQGHQPSYNVILLGVDSTSRLNFHRHMPKTKMTLEKLLQAVEMKGYTKVGDNTFPNMLPLLTSYSLEELQKTCNPKQWTAFDDCPFIWKELKERNILTAFIEDCPTQGIFTYYRPGFVNAPTDIYPRNGMLAASLGRWDKMCPGPQRHEKVILDYIIDLASLSESQGVPYFFTNWFACATHNQQNAVKFLDSILAETLVTMNDRGLLKNTLLFVMSDHGYRFMEYRATLEGWYEDKLPFLWINPPESKRSLRKILQSNSDLVTSPFDVHATIRDVLNLPQAAKTEGTSDLRGLSLFKKVPDRSCKEAGIPSFFCACDAPKYYEKQSVIFSAADAVVAHINHQIPTLCLPLRVQRIFSAGYLRHLDDHQLHLLIALTTKPGGFQFEALVVFENEEDVHPQVVHFARTNKMTRSIDCLEVVNKRNTLLEQICFCQVLHYGLPP